MSNPTVQPTPTTNAGISPRSIKDPATKGDLTQALKENLVSKEHRETINEFMDKIHQATIEGGEWVETSPEIIKHYNRGGLGKAEYFVFQGIKVCEQGKREALEEKLGKQIGQELYGSSEGKVAT